MNEKITTLLAKIFKKKILIIVIFSMAGALLISGSLYLSLNNDKEELKETIKAEETTSEETTTEIIAETTTAETEKTSVTPISQLNIQTNLTTAQQNAIDPEESTTTTESPSIILEKPETVTNAYYGIDVSRYQGTIDWAKVKAAGVDFAIIRLGYRGYGTAGTLVLDSQFYNNINGAITNGVDVGIYFFSQALNEAEAAQEASMVIGYLEPYKNSITYPVAFDWEGYDNSAYRVYYGKNNWTPEKLNALSTTFCDMVKSAGYTPMHYGNKSAFNSWGFNNSILASKYKIWFSHPTSGGLTTPTDYRGSFQIWQYSFNGSISGISGSVDLNVALGSLQLNISNRNLTYPLNTIVNFMDGVTASSTIGTDITSSITITIKNTSGLEVTQAQALATAGTYTITYSVYDVFGSSKTDIANLMVV